MSNTPTSLHIAAVSILILTILYIAFAFICMQPNPAEWSKPTRGTLSFFWIVATLIYYGKKTT